MEAYRIKIDMYRKDDEGWSRVTKYSPAFTDKNKAIDWFERYVKNKQNEIIVLYATIIYGELKEKEPGHYIFEPTS